jgi:hypothetical protein
MDFGISSREDGRWMELVQDGAGANVSTRTELIMIWYDMIYLLTAIGLPTGASSTVHIYKQYTERQKKQTNKQYIEHKTHYI